MTAKNHGGARPGAGAKAKDGAKPDTTFLLKLESAKKAKLKRLGAASGKGASGWLRGQIDLADDPADEEKTPAK